MSKTPTRTPDAVIAAWPSRRRLEHMDDYLVCVLAFPLMPIRNDAHLDEALRVVDTLMDIEHPSDGQDAYLNVLSELVRAYEQQRVKWSPVRGADVLHHLMDANGLTQQDMVPYFGTPSIVSEVLSGKRKLALSHMRKLSERFALPIEAFLDDPAAPAE